MVPLRLRWLLPVMLALGGAACEPQDRRPGTWLTGEPAAVPDDWSFTDAHPEIFVQTRTWYCVPHSVTTVVAAGDGVLYVPSIYEAEVPFPGTKFWNKNVAGDPRVRVKIGDSLYEMDARPILDDAEFLAAFAALAAKYPFWKKGLEDPSARPPFVILKLTPRAG